MAHPSTAAPPKGPCPPSPPPPPPSLPADDPRRTRCPALARPPTALLLSTVSLTTTAVLLLVHCFLSRDPPLPCPVCRQRQPRPTGNNESAAAVGSDYESRRRREDGGFAGQRHQRRRRPGVIVALEGTAGEEGWEDERGSRRPRRRLPQCLIIGVRKGGTRALLEFLDLHPSIQAEKQEMHFFDDDRHYALGLDWYRKRMRRSLPAQITVEKTPAYFADERVPARVRRMNRTVRLLLTVRDPVDRTVSDYLQIRSSRLQRGRSHPAFEDLVLDRATGEVNRSYKAIRRSVYHLHFERWLRHFPLEQFHFVSGENLVRDPVAELRKVERFLGIDNLLDDRQFVYNRSRGFYCMAGGAGGGGGGGGGGERCLAPSKGRAHPRIDPGVLEKLRQFFRPHNLRFYRMVGVDFGWQ